MLTSWIIGFHLKPISSGAECWLSNKWPDSSGYFWWGSHYTMGEMASILFQFTTDTTSVPLKKIVTCICHWLIVPLLWILCQILISYCKFIMPNALKWDILHICTLVIYQDMYSLIQIQVTILLSGTDVIHGHT